MHPSQRPSLDEVRDWFAAALTHEALDAYLALLDADPNWLVSARSSGATRLLQMYYYPKGEWLTVVLRDAGGRWRPDPLAQ